MKRNRNKDKTRPKIKKRPHRDINSKILLLLTAILLYMGYSKIALILSFISCYEIAEARTDFGYEINEI